MRAARVELGEANAFVDLVHRHHDPVLSHRFSIGAHRDGKVVGVAICGRPVAKAIDPKHVLEVNRCATDGTRNACSYLYGKAARIATELGFRAVITYTLTTEEGASLRACGWWPEELKPRDPDWSSKGRPRKRKRGTDIRAPKIRWLWLTGIEPTEGSR